MLWLQCRFTNRILKTYFITLRIFMILYSHNYRYYIGILTLHSPCICYYLILALRPMTCKWCILHCERYTYHIVQCAHSTDKAKCKKVQILGIHIYNFWAKYANVTLCSSKSPLNGSSKWMFDEKIWFFFFQKCKTYLNKLDFSTTTSFNLRLVYSILI